MKIPAIVIFSLALMTFLSAGASAPPHTPREIRLGPAVCRITDSTLIVSTGRMKRIYHITPWGLATVELSITNEKPSRTEPAIPRAAMDEVTPRADWHLGLTGRALWTRTTLAIGDDSGFTSPHITVLSEFVYPAAGVRLRHIIWAYPNSGIRTQLELQTLARDKPATPPADTAQQVEYIPLGPGKTTLTTFGYYNDTQNRDEDSTFILKEERLPNGTAAFIDWASGLVAGHEKNGWILVKESHKCVNQQGVLTGGFQVAPEGITVTGAGLEASDLTPDRYRQCWASWIIPYNGDSIAAMLALKEFDRKRYPVHRNDIYMMANTWGNSANPADGRYAARQENILREIASQKDLGIDVQQIDDGWQGQDYREWKPARSATATLPGQNPQPVHYDVYPDGWTAVKTYAAKQKIGLGLWASWTIPEADLKWNYDHGAFHYVKLDFSNLNTKQKLDSLMQKARALVRYSHDTVRINWDVTENAPRVGYYFARELGNVYLENRKLSVPAGVIYRPHLVLRDAWQLAKYASLNQFQLSVQNVDLVDRHRSDAYLYPQAYCTAITLMGSPLFFGLTQLYSEKAREETRNLVGIYKRHRDEMYAGYVFPIGQIPDNNSWTGFEDVLPGKDAGYLLLFRELHNDSSSRSIRLSFVRNKDIELTDLVTGEKKRVTVDRDGFASFVIDRPAGFRFYRYSVLRQPIPAAAKAKQPNIIFILVDDQGYGDLGAFYQNQRSRAHDRSLPCEYSPNLDRLAAEGAMLTQHYCAAPVCAPSRASLLLGVSQGHANVRDNQFDKALEDNYTMASTLRMLGYSTAAIGKWGLQGLNAPEPSWPGHPLKRGFDYFFGYIRHGDGHEHYPKEGLYDGPKEVWDGYTNVAGDLDKCYTADLWTAVAKKYITEHVAGKEADKPFFLYLAYETPHAVLELPTQAYPQGGGLQGGLQWLGTPGHMINTASGKVDAWVEPDYDTATYDDDRNPATPEAPWPDTYKRYATANRRIDHGVGDLMQLLKDLRLDSNTLVVYTSDNGPSIESYLPKGYVPNQPTFFGSYGPFDGIKRDNWEGGVRMPTIACWPGVIPAGRVVTQPSISYDWAPTFLASAGMPAPARMDGVSLLPALTGRGRQESAPIYIEYYFQGKTPDFQEFGPGHRGRVRNQMQTIRIGDYVGVRYDIRSGDDDFEIYDVVTDPGERHNLAATHADLQRRLKAEALQERRPDAEAPRPYDSALVPAAAVSSGSAHGVKWEAYDSVFPWIPQVETLTAKARGIAASVDHVPAGANRSGQRLLHVKGYIVAPGDGSYTFYLRSDNKALLRIHDATVIDEDYHYPPGSERSAVIRLQAGPHPFRLFYYPEKTSGHPDLEWSGPGIPRQPIWIKLKQRGR